MDNWNELELKPPPTSTCKVTASQVSFSDLRKISDTCWNALTLLKNQETLCSEAATLSRLIHRMRSMFRGDKGFKSIQKVHQCLRHFLALNLIPIYESFFRTIPWDCSDKEVFCPTRQMLEYVLMRTQGFAALLCRIVHTCLEAASLLKGRMSSGHNWQVSLLCLGAVSRIWSLAKHLLNSCIEWYDIMLPYLKKFQPKGPLWLSEKYVFPSNLTCWLSLPWMGTPEPQNESIMNFDDQSQEDFNTSVNEDISAFTGHINPKIMTIRDDVGESISRSSIPMLASATTTPEGNKDKAVSKTQEKLKPKKKSKDLTSDSGNKPKKNIKKKASKTKNMMSAISSIETQNDVENFLSRETNNRSQTSSLSEDQWLLLKNLVSKLNLKLKKLKDENKRQKLLEQIRTALKMALS